MRISDWSSDVCASDLGAVAALPAGCRAAEGCRGLAGALSAVLGAEPRPAAGLSRRAADEGRQGRRRRWPQVLTPLPGRTARAAPSPTTGSARGRERVCTYAEISGDAVSYKKKPKLEELNSY